MSHVWVIEHLEAGKWTPGYVVWESREAARVAARMDHWMGPAPKVQSRIRKYVRAKK